MTKKEVVTYLRKAFNAWARRLPDVEYSRPSEAQENYDDGNIGLLHKLELGAEEGGEK